MVDLVQQHRFFLLPETLQHTGAGDVEFDVAHHFPSFEATVNQGNLARCQRFWHAVRDSLFGQHQSGDKRRVRHAPTRLGENFHAGWVGQDTVRAIFSHRFRCLDSKASKVLLHGPVNLSGERGRGGGHHLVLSGVNDQGLEMLPARFFGLTVSSCDGRGMNTLQHQLPSVLQQFC